MKEQKKIVKDIKQLLRENKELEDRISLKKNQLRKYMDKFGLDSLKADGLNAYITKATRWVLKDKDEAMSLGLMEEKEYESFTVRLNNKKDEK